MSDPFSYDPDARRDTPLALKLKAQIRRDGPMALGQFIGECLWNETYGYYATKAVIGRNGDFITAPEISQVFGELLGLWSAVVWQKMGEPAPVHLMELGPGRGTLMADALRAASRVPRLASALCVMMVEMSASLRERQKQTLAGGAIPITIPIAWCEVPDVSPAPVILLANEFLDCLAPEQCVKTADGWRWRLVALDETGRFQFEPSPMTRLHPDADKRWPNAVEGSIFESVPLDRLAEDLKRVASRQPLAALFIDYGHTSTALGDTLQAVRAHVYEHPLCSPGEADLTVQVDFAAFARAMTAAGFAVDGPLTQAEFLGRLGIVERASKLMAANPAKAGEIEAGVLRLMAPNGMGTRFKVIGVRSPSVAKLPGF
jgi:NADH dehydrogenase [ubiquinone] 1 alpha subcomplex assembly factor 7